MDSTSIILLIAAIILAAACVIVTTVIVKKGNFNVQDEDNVVINKRNAYETFFYFAKDNLKQFDYQLVLKPVYKKDQHIDMVLLSTKGIFVLVLKNYSGTITGKESDANWVYKVGDEGHLKNNFYKDNEENAKCISEILQNNAENIVIFTRGNIDELVGDHIFTLDNFLKYHNSLEDKLTKVEIDNYYKILLEKKLK